MHVKKVTLVVAFVAILLAGVGAVTDCNDDSDCTGKDLCTDYYCDMADGKCASDAIPGCVTCTHNNGTSLACIPSDDCNIMACNSSLASVCVETSKANCTADNHSNFTSLGVMLGLIAIYVVAMYFMLENDKKQYPNLESPFYKVDPNAPAASTATVAASTASLESGTTSPHTSPSTSPILPHNGADKEPTKDDEGCCRCCGCCGCKKGKKDKKDSTPAPPKEKGIIATFLFKNPITKADKTTLTLCTLLSNVVFSAGLNHHDAVSSHAQQYFIGLISGSAAVPVMTMITMAFTRLPRKYIIIAYGFAYAFCVTCFIVALIYTIRLEQSKANKWLVSTAISTGQDLFMAFASYAMLYFCPACACLTGVKQQK